MRFLLAVLLAMSLSFLPAAGLARAAAPAMSCHGASHETPVDKGRACAEHCLMLVTPAQLAPALQPSIENSVRFARTMVADRAPPREGVAPETPPPRR
jgi:hypothetical protein